MGREAEVGREWAAGEAQLVGEERECGVQNLRLALGCPYKRRLSLVERSGKEDVSGSNCCGWDKNFREKLK